jgi:beta-N-acetylhexosaminidase
VSELERAAYGVLLAGFAGPEVPAWLGPAHEQGLAGICLYGNNVAPGRDLAGLARCLRAIAPTAVLAVDEEGGDVTRLHAATGSPYAGPAALGRYDDAGATRTVAEGIGAELAAAGIWLDLAPCADVNSDPANPVIGTRSFGADPELVARHTVAFVEGLRAAGVAACVKHFPGHGDTTIDSHHELPRVTAGREVLDARELVPFRAAVAAGAAAVMTSHVVLKALDPGRPATFSPQVLADLLRGELGFQGVVVSDALDMAGAGGPKDVGPAAVRALAAGADLLCLGPGRNGSGPVQVRLAVRAVTEAVERGVLPAGRLLDAAARVERLRTGWARPTPSGDRDPAVARAREASARVAADAVADVPQLTGATVVVLDTAASPAVGDTAWGVPSLGGPVLRLRPDQLATTPVPVGPVLVVARRAAADPAVWHWVRNALATNESAWLAELGWPDPRVEAMSRVIRTYGASAVSTEALARGLRGLV